MIAIDVASSVPPYEQVRAGIVDAVADGTLAPGHRLPSVRAFADELGVAPGTVARAYKELEAIGVVETRGRNGTVVSPHGDAARREAQRAAADYAALTRALGIEPAEALSIVTAAVHS